MPAYTKRQDAPLFSSVAPDGTNASPEQLSVPHSDTMKYDGRTRSRKISASPSSIRTSSRGMDQDGAGSAPAAPLSDGLHRSNLHRFQRDPRRPRLRRRRSDGLRHGSLP